MNKLIEKEFIVYLKQNGLIEPDEVEIYQYGFCLLLKKIFYTLCAIIVGVLGGEVLGMTFFLICYISIREYSGGYHAKTNIGCCICTLGVIFCALQLMRVMKIVPWFFTALLMMIWGYVIWVLLPQEAITKPLDMNEKVAYRKKTRRNVIIFVFISLLGYFFEDIFQGIACAIIIQGNMLLVRILEKRKNMTSNKKRI